MNDQIFETIVTTVAPSAAVGTPHVAPNAGIGAPHVAPSAGIGAPHVAPMGIRYRDGHVILMPFRPSTTLDNILATGHAVLNLVTDTRVFAGAVTARWLGQREFPLKPAERIGGVRLAAALHHVELRLLNEGGDPQRPVLTLERVHEASHAPFPGFNRAQAAVIEGAVLVSRLHMLSAEKIDGEIAYLQIAIDKTAGPQEHEAWGWLREAIARQRAAALPEFAQTAGSAGSGAA